MIATKTKARFLRKVVVNQSTGCWEWVGYVEKNGYGRFGMNGRMQWAHRASYMLFVGPIGNGLEIDHLCKNTRCSNPEHLEAVTHAVNMQRADRGAPVERRQKTHCPKGHPYHGANLIVYRNMRYCRLCQQQHKQNHKKRKRLLTTCVH